jgi:hypothetical protein
MRIKSLVAGLVLSSVGLMSGVSHAAVTQLVLRTTGTACSQLDNSSNEPYDATMIKNEWGISNGSPVLTQTVVCPLTLNVGPNSSLSIVRVNVWDRSANPVTCTLWRIDSNGKVALDTKSSSVNQSAQTQISLGNLAQSNGATLSLMCSLPPSTANGVSGIASVETAYNAQ